MAVDSPRKNISIALNRVAPENFETVEPKEGKYPGFRQNIYDYLTEFSNNTGIHGFQYMAERERSILEKCYWAILFAISLCFCIFLVMQAWMKWDQTPVIVSFAPNPTPVWEIPFPAITICPENKARARVYNYTYYYHKIAEEMEEKREDPTAQSNLTAEELQKFLYTSLICYNSVEINETTSNETIEHLIKWLRYLTRRGFVFAYYVWGRIQYVWCNLAPGEALVRGMAVTKHIGLPTSVDSEWNYIVVSSTDIQMTSEVKIRSKDPPRDGASWIAPQKAEVFFECLWNGVDVNCDILFYPILTEYGVCFTFNMLDRSELFTNAVYLREDFMSHDKRSAGWSLDGGYPKKVGKDTFPRRAMSTRFEDTLYMDLRSYEGDQDHICRGPDQGFMVLLHHPADHPRLETEYFRAPLNQSVAVRVNAEVMTTSAGLRNYDPNIKRCYFSDERRLMFFKNYTQQNCQTECFANYTLARCGCAAFHMPRVESTKICGNESSLCISKAQKEILAREVESGIYVEEDEDDIPTSLQCDCLPACFSIRYKAQTSQADFNFKKHFEVFKYNNLSEPGLQMTRIQLNFEKNYFTTYERNELYGQTDFVANCGGLLGLFTGFSFLSIAEIVYFLSLRVICNVKKNGKQFWSGSKTLLDDDANLPK